MKLRMLCAVSWHTFRALALVTFIQLTSTQAALAQFSFLDDFEDNDLRDSVPVRWNSGTAVDGKLQIIASNVAIAVPNVDVNDGWSMRTLASLSEGSWVGTGIQGVVGTNVWIAMGASAQLAIGTPGVTLVEVQTDLDRNSVMLRFDAFDGKLQGWAWNPGDPEPIEPLIEIETAVPSGRPGLWAEGILGNPPVTARFEFFEASTTPLAIPEPSSLLLAVVGISAIGLARRTR